MDNLSKCPICGSEEEVMWSPTRFRVWCGNCGFVGPREISIEKGKEAYNTLCRELEVGKAVLERVPDGWEVRDHGPYITHPPGEDAELIYPLKPIPEPPDPIEVLRRWQEIDHATISDGKYLQLRKDTIAALKAERKEQ